MRIARGPIALKYALVLVTLPGLAACGLLGSDVEAERVDRANVSVQQTTPPADGADDADAASADPTPRTTSQTPASRKTTRSEPAKKKKTSTTTKKKTSTTKKTTKPAPKPTTKTTKPSGGSGGGSGGSGGSTNTDAEAEVLRLVNVERGKVGCKPLKADSLLVKVARAHSKDMAVKQYFSHTSKDGRSPFDRMSDAGYKYSWAAENIAAGARTPASVMDMWMNSSGHKKNILNCKLTELGVGMWNEPGSPYGMYWTQNFGTPA